MSVRSSKMRLFSVDRWIVGSLVSLTDLLTMLSILSLWHFVPWRLTWQMCPEAV